MLPRSGDGSGSSGYGWTATTVSPSASTSKAPQCEVWSRRSRGMRRSSHSRERRGNHVARGGLTPLRGAPYFGGAVKISAFHLMPYRELPADFEQRYESVWVTPPWWELADARRVGDYYNWTLDELLHAARSGFDGLCTNEHHQNAYGFMPSPNLMGSVLARGTQGTNVAVAQMGATLPTSNPPIRVAEEYAMLDCISGGRLVAGLPLGSPMDVNLCYGITPMEHRERYREAFALTLKAWH